MSQRTEKAASLIKQIAAASLRDELGNAAVTVTAAEVSPDMRSATVWVGILADNEAHRQEQFKEIEAVRHQVQRQIAQQFSSKFVPRVMFRIDTSGEYADHISRIIGGLK